MFIKNEYLKILSKEQKTAIDKASDIACRNNIKIYLIGGIVRDILLNNEIKDIDIAVEADAVEFAEKIKNSLNCEILKKQENLRTASVRFENGIVIDFASTREELYEAPGILPKAHNFGCGLALDVKRRDFTVNTLAMGLNGEDKYKLFDYYGGYNDLKSGKLSVLHDNSFIDDPSRIVRAFKFKIRLNFEISSHTKRLLDSFLLNPLKNIPLERIKSEFLQYFSIKNNNIYNEIIENKVYKLISDKPIEKVNLKRLEEIEKYALFTTEDLSLILIFCLIINSDFAYNHLNLTAYEKKVIISTKKLMEEPEIDINDNMKIYKSYINQADLTIALYYLISGDKTVLKFLDALRQIKVLVTGKDLIDLGFIPSKIFNELFDKILREKLNGNLKTLNEELNYIKLLK